MLSFAAGFSCSLNVFYEGLGKSKLLFWSIKEKTYRKQSFIFRHCVWNFFSLAR